MFKKIFFFCVMFLVSGLFVNAKSSFVNNQEEFLEALNDESINTIVLNKNIETTQKINITRDIYIDGAGHTMTYTGTFGDDGKDKTSWNGIYVLQVYRSTATIKDIKLTGGNAGLLINGSLVTFLGTIDVSGNGFGGIELAQGSGVEEISKLSLKDGAKITNSTESKDRPTLWVPEDTPKAVLDINGETKNISANTELTLAEINELFGIEENNPDTGITITPYLFLVFMSSIILYFSAKQTLKKDF